MAQYDGLYAPVFGYCGTGYFVMLNIWGYKS